MHGPADTSGSDCTQLLAPGYRVGSWEVTEPIAAGGWGTVYAGRAVGGDRPAQEVVALKFLPTSGLAPRQARNVVDTARREVELGRRAGHPRLIRLLDSVVLSEPDHPLLDGALVLVMERAHRSLRDRLRAGPVGEAEGARLITGICEGLAHLHRTGWVHGDLKPDNILLMADGSVRLSDFGLAAELTGTHGTHGYAPPMGTFDYLPPERWRAPLGEHGVQVRPSADIWALGIVIHEVFTGGTPPFPGATPMARGAAVQEYADGRAPLRLDPAVPHFWRELAADCLAPSHAARAAHTAQSLLARVTARPRPGKDRPAGRTRRAVHAALVSALMCGAAAGSTPYAALDGTFAPPGAAGRIRVFNAEPSCTTRTDRDPDCSLGLAIDPQRPYTADNVVPTRVWQGDELAVDCLLAHGIPIIDEGDAWSPQWFRVRLAAGSPRPTAWLPAVRTKDRPRVPACPAPASGR
ncbi:MULTISPECIES: serine/threonine-protein kinase [unclassified Streptomyces]|uniref:serine/threonine-protein kinase n=1 Tax=unclassified Streptomyces TaxID=2593676 RepID=UPI002E31A2C1|nr:MULTISPECIES: serine/threonine-protein kinase [unclassified Streptomyces]WUC67581.1 serine/threonine protein kinase [Streptomyces sp. NBC_00539]